MEKVLEQTLPKEVIEVQEAIAPPQPEGGFPWCGVGIGVGVVVLAAVFAKLYKCTAKVKNEGS